MSIEECIVDLRKRSSTTVLKSRAFLSLYRAIDSANVTAHDVTKYYPYSIYCYSCILYLYCTSKRDLRFGTILENREEISNVLIYYACG